MSLSRTDLEKGIAAVCAARDRDTLSAIGLVQAILLMVDDYRPDGAEDRAARRRELLREAAGNANL